MSKEAFDKIESGLKEAIDYAQRQTIDPLRAQLAGQILSGLYALQASVSYPAPREMLITEAISIADALIAELKKEGE